MVARDRNAEGVSIDVLLDELAALRDLDRLRQAFPPGSEAHAIASEQVARRSRALMDRFRELKDETREPGRPRLGIELPRIRRRRQPRPRSPLIRLSPPARGAHAL